MMIVVGFVFVFVSLALGTILAVVTMVISAISVTRRRKIKLKSKKQLKWDGKNKKLNSGFVYDFIKRVSVCPRIIDIILAS
jgi:hypothetical protein